MCRSGRSDNRPHRPCRSAPGMGHWALTPAVEISKIESAVLQLARLTGRKKPGADADQRERTDSFGAGRSNTRPGKRHRNGRDRFQGVRGKRFGMDESIARSWISARPDPADACLQAFISRFCAILHSLEDALPPASQPFGAKIKQYGHRAGGPDGAHRNTETVHAGSPCHVL